MQAGGSQRQEEHGKHLRRDRALDLCGRHPHLLQDAEALLILIAFGDLLVIHDEHGRHQKQGSEEDAEEE